MSDKIEIIENPESFSSEFMRILDKDQRLVPFTWNDLQKDFYKNRTGKDIILKSRQIGFSTLIQGLLFHKVVTSSQSTITLAHDNPTTQALRRIQDRYFDNFPEDIKEFHRPIRKISNETVSTYPETNSTMTIATAGSKNVGRGMTYTMFHGSEGAFWADAEKIIAGALQGMSKPNIVLESTPNGQQGYFYQLCMDSLSGRNDWKLHFYPYTMFSAYMTPGWAEAKRRELGRYFDQEYPSNVLECFLSSNIGFFSDMIIDWSAPKNSNPIANHVYTMGVDWGQSGDFTVAIVVDRTDSRMVDYIRLNRMSWNLQRLDLHSLYKKWRPQGVRVEANSMGSVNIEELIKDGMNVESFDTTNKSKGSIFQKLHEDLETGLKLIDWDVLHAEMNTMTSKQTPTGLWTISADGNSKDDTCIALALAVTAKIGRPQIKYY